MDDQSTGSRPVRFSVGGLLAATALVAIAAAPAAWLGGVYAISAAVSLVLLFLAGRVIARRGGSAWILVPCLLGVVASGLLFSSALFLQAVGTLLVFAATGMAKGYPRSRLLACVAVMFLAYIPMFRHAIASDQRIDGLRRAYPIVSIRDRLPDLSDHAFRPVVLTNDQNIAMSAIDDVIGRRSNYPLDLRRLHQESYKRFARSPGFGISRMGPVTERRLEREIGEFVGEPVALPVRLPSKANFATPDEVHRVTQVEFLESDRLGYVEEAPDRVAGFLGHGMGPRPYDGRSFVHLQDPEAEIRWTLHRLELIGLLTHDEPVAYVSDVLPNMEDLADAPTRELDEFEAVALEKLHVHDDLVTEETTEDGVRHVKMVGALRAAKSCAACHNVPHGTLLGAFRYDLSRDAAPES